VIERATAPEGALDPTLAPEASQGASVLETLATTAGPVPRVLLRDRWARRCTEPAI
jgi:hypothetical protein